MWAEGPSSPPQEQVKSAWISLFFYKLCHVWWLVTTIYSHFILNNYHFTEIEKMCQDAEMFISNVFSPVMVNFTTALINSWKHLVMRIAVTSMCIGFNNSAIQICHLLSHLGGMVICFKYAVISCKSILQLV